MTEHQTLTIETRFMLQDIISAFTPKDNMTFAKIESDFDQPKIVKNTVFAILHDTPAHKLPTVIEIGVLMSLKDENRHYTARVYTPDVRILLHFTKLDIKMVVDAIRNAIQLNKLNDGT